MRRISVVSVILTAMLLASAAAFAADKPKYQGVDPNRIPDIEKLGHAVGGDLTASTSRSTWGTSVPLAASPPPGSPGYRVGSTTYDYQHNSSTGRQVAVLGAQLQTTWMRAQFNNITDRTVYWNKMSVTGSATITLDTGGTVDVLTLDNLGSINGAEAAPSGSTRPGYTNIRILTNGRGVAFFHDAPEDTLVGTASFAAVDNAPAIGLFNQTVVPQPAGTLLDDEAIWPKGDVQVFGGDTIVHLVARDRYEAGTSRIWYWRGTISGTAITWATPLFIDSLFALSHCVEVDPNGNNVSIVWAKPQSYETGGAGFYDIVYQESTDKGLSWGAPINATNFDTLVAGPMAYSDPDAVYDDDGTLHVVYTSVDYRLGDDGEFGSFFQPAGLWEWNNLRNDSRTIASANWANSCNLEGNPNSGGSGNLLLAKPNIVVKPALAGGIAEEILYAVWSQFGPTDSPFVADCATQSDSSTLGGEVNSEIYCSASSNDGLTWDRPFNLTGTVTPDCAPGDCHSEHWVTAAARADSGIYLSYVDDSHAGGIVQATGSGAWSTSNYMLYAPKVRTPVLEPRIVVAPISFTELNVNSTGTPDTVIVTVSNVGNADLMYTVSVTLDDAGPTYVQVENTTSFNSTILAAGAPDVLEIVFDGNGLSNPSEQNWRLEVTSNDATNDPGQGGSAIDVGLNVFVADTWFTCTSDTISTGQRLMAVTSCLELGNQGSGGGLLAYASEQEWIYDASPTLTYRPSAGSPTVYRDVFYGSAADRSRDSNRAFRAQSAITVHRDTLVSNGDTTFLADRASGVASSTDSIFQIDWTATAFKDPAINNGAVFHYTLSPKTSDGIGGTIVMGAAADLDVDSLSSSNDGIADEPKQYVGAQGGYGDTLGFVGQNNYAALFYMPLDTGCSNTAVGGQVLDNVDYIYPANGYVTDTLLNWYETSIVAWGSQTEQMDTITDVNVIMKDRSETWTNTETYEWSFGLAVSDVSIADLEDQIARIRTAANSGCLSGCPILLTGDVNESGAITSADIIYMVGFVFKGGPGPNPCDAAGDVNCSGAVTSADIIFMVGFVFKGGPPPCDGCTSPLVSGC